MACGRWVVSRSLSRAFTLTELLIVVGIIVLIILIALPAFNALTGSRSVEGGLNQVSAFLARARVEAIGLQEHRGVMFFRDPVTDRIAMVLVREAPLPSASTLDVVLDLVDDRDTLLLPPGIGVQTILGAAPEPPAPRNSHGYIGLNPITGASVQIGGTILFDSAGRLAIRSYGLLTRDSGGSETAMGRWLYAPGAPPANPAFVSIPFATQAGLTVFERQAFVNRFGEAGWTDGTYTAAELEEERWLDDNGIPVLVNRYNGTLVRGE
jgi:hypothetical protein